MDQIDYNEHVRLLLPGEGPRETTLAEAVRAVMLAEDQKTRLGAVIVRHGQPLRQFSEIEAIYSQPDFPNSN